LPSKTGLERRTSEARTNVGVEACMKQQRHQAGVTAFFDMLSAPEVAYVH